MKFRKVAALAVIVGASVLGLSACNVSGSSKNAQTTQTKILNDAGNKLVNAEPYPLSEMNDSDERANLTERLIRFNDPNKIGYLYELNNANQPTGYYVVKGKISSTDSQLTPTQVITTKNGERFVVDAQGDDGSYGLEEGGTNGIFFFTTSGVIVEYNGKWQYSDAPLAAANVPLLIAESSKPTSTAGHLK